MNDTPTDAASAETAARSDARDAANPDRILFISWAPFCSRSDSIAARLGGKSVMIYSPFWGSHPATILFKYLSQSIKTLWVLIRERPRVIFVMTPPPVACFPVWFYTLFSRARYVIDAHTGAFLMPMWQKVSFLHKFASRRALTTLVTNDYLKSIVDEWGADSLIMPDVPVVFAEPSDFQPEGECKMTLVSTFTNDEPTELFLEAAAHMPDVHFYVTGDYRRGGERVLELKPDNVTFTGFLSDEDYVALISRSDASICLTTFDHTMQRGAYEAVYLSRPVIVSDFQVLRDAFPQAAVYVPNTIEGIVEGVRQMRDEHARYVGEVEALRQAKLDRWQRVVAALRSLWAKG